MNYFDAAENIHGGVYANSIGLTHRRRVVFSFPPEDCRESQDGGGRACENWGEDKKASLRALSHHHLGFLDDLPEEKRGLLAVYLHTSERAETRAENGKQAKIYGGPQAQSEFQNALQILKAHSKF